MDSILLELAFFSLADHFIRSVSVSPLANCCIQAAGSYTTTLWLLSDVGRVHLAGVGGAFGVSGFAHDYIENCEL